MKLEEYQEGAAETAIFPNELPEFIEVGQVYTVLGEAGETGEVSEKLKKAIREDDETYIEEMRAEVGDTIWYCSQICEEFGWSLEDIASDNLEKLSDRKERGQLCGKGDNR